MDDILPRRQQLNAQLQLQGPQEFFREQWVKLHQKWEQQGGYIREWEPRGAHIHEQEPLGVQRYELGVWNLRS